jgi:hypothetical protein
MLADPAARRAQARRFAERHLGRDDSLAAIRHNLARQIGRQADEAAAAGGMVLALGRIGPPDLPLPVSMACFDHSGLVRVKPGDNPAKVLAACTHPGLSRPEAEALDAQERVDPADGYELVEDHPHIAYRKVEVDSGETVAEAAGGKVAQLRATYLQYVPRFGVVRTVFSTPVVAAGEVWLEVFDAVTALFSAGPRPAADMDVADKADEPEKSEVE